MRTQYVQAHMDSLGLILYEVVTPPAVKMMSEVLRMNGYYCTNNDKTDYQFAPPVTAWDESSRYAHWRNGPKGKPFFSIFNFGITHESQVFGPSSKRNLRYNESFPQDPATDPVAGWGEKIDSSEWHFNVPEDLEVPIPPYLPDTDPVKNDIRRLYSNIIEMDKQVGILLKQLEEDGELENTIIVWYSDHGGPLPRQKRLLYDSGIKVPLIIRYPGKQFAAEIDDQLISFIDLAPTTFFMAGIPVPQHLQGRSFLDPSTTPKRQYIHAAADRFDTEYDMIRAVRDKKFKYLKNFKPDKPYYLPVAYRENMATMKELLRLNASGELNAFQAQWFRSAKPEEELFDCEADPHELNNLADDPAYHDKLVELRNECMRWMDEIGDKGNVSEKDLITSFWPDWQQPVTENPIISNEDGLINASCATPGASIGYQVISEGQPATTQWQVFTEPFAINDRQKVVALAHRIGFKPSKKVTVNPAQP